MNFFLGPFYRNGKHIINTQGGVGYSLLVLRKGGRLSVITQGGVRD